MKDDEELNTLFKRYRKFLFKAANNAQTENAHSFVMEFNKGIDKAGVHFKQLAQRVIDKIIPDVKMSRTAESVLRKAGAFHETANVKLTTYVQMVSKLTESAEQFKGRIQDKIAEDEKNGIITTVSDLKEYIKSDLKSGLGTSVTYSNGAKMPVDKYAEMLARTTRTETQNLAMLGKALDDGNDLVECSTISPTCPTCAIYQGRIYSISGNTPGYPALYKTAFRNGYSCIHPNCRHQFFPYNPKFHTEEERKELEKNSRRPMNEELQSDGARSAYARSQMQMRQWNKELNEFAEYQKLCAARGEDPAYKTLGSFRRAYRSEEGSLAYAKTHYYRRDERELESYKKVLGEEKAPQSLEILQRLKYNKDKQKYTSLRIEFEDEKVRRKLGSDDLPLTIHSDRQGKHIRGHKNFTDNKSYLAAETVEEGLTLSRDIVKKYHGTGELQRSENGGWKHTEKVTTDRIVGFAKRYDGKWVETKSATIHYSKTGAHIVPTILHQ